jgi:hypothetical protein
MRLLACAIGAAVLSSVALHAQWPTYKAQGVPRAKSGEVNLTAPPPKTLDGKPDLSGVWENPSAPSTVNSSIAGTGGSPPIPGTQPRPQGGAPGGGGGPVRLFFDVGAGVPGGLPFQPWAAELRKKRMADNMKDNPDAHCLPMGNLQFHTHPQPRKIVQAPKTIVILYEGNAGTRQIFLDGRPLPNNDPQPWWYGYSTGKWEGNTLVVQTSGFRDGGWLDVAGSPLTDEAMTIERFRRPTFGTLEIEVTVNDPKAYTKPWTVNFTQRLLPDEELIEFICGENETSTKLFDK